jgi:hypothetical protein
MADCGSISACPFFNDKMQNMPGGADLFKQYYCLDDNSKCARYMVSKALGKQSVPSNLFPNQMLRAKQIIAQG